jgi:prepilin-type N-terminal cleavage/methylation domain-containing protein
MRIRGFTLVEVLIAMAVVLVSALAAIQLVTLALDTMARARRQSQATLAAAARMEQLRLLRFEYDAAGLRVTDTTTDLASDPPAGGGPGLTPSPPLALAANLPGSVDYLDADGVVVGAGAAVPPRAVFVRRWSVEPIDASGDALAIQVVVQSIAEGSRSEARLVSIRARVRP